jgi:hypothetical protein
MSASMRQQAKVSRRVWSTLLSLASRNITLENDWLGQHYAVNKWGIRASHVNKGWLDSVLVKLIEKLKTDGWIAEKSGSSVVLRHPDTPAYIHIGESWVHLNQAQCNIGVG